MITTLSLLVLLILGILAVFRSLTRSRAKMAPKGGDARLKRIQDASWWMLVLMGLWLLLGIYWMLAFLFGWPFLGHHGVRMVVSGNHIYSSLADMPPEIRIWWVIKMGWGLFGCGTLLALFWLYQRGILFSAKNVVLIRALGYWLIVNWGIDDQLQSVVRDVDLSLTPVFVGLLIIFVSWIMDEGRKIQEEQELTV